MPEENILQWEDERHPLNKFLRQHGFTYPHLESNEIEELLENGRTTSYRYAHHLPNSDERGWPRPFGVDKKQFVNMLALSPQKTEELLEVPLNRLDGWFHKLQFQEYRPHFYVMHDGNKMFGYAVFIRTRYIRQPFRSSELHWFELSPKEIEGALNKVLAPHGHFIRIGLDQKFISSFNVP